MTTHTLASLAECFASKHPTYSRYLFDINKELHDDKPASTRCHYCSHSFIPGVDKVRLVPKLRKTAHIARIERNIKIKGRSSQCPRRLNIWDHWNRTRAKLVRTCSICKKRDNILHPESQTTNTDNVSKIEDVEAITVKKPRLNFEYTSGRNNPDIYGFSVNKSNDQKVESKVKKKKKRKSGKDSANKVVGPLQENSGSSKSAKKSSPSRTTNSSKKSSQTRNNSNSKNKSTLSNASSNSKNSLASETANKSRNGNFLANLLKQQSALENRNLKTRKGLEQAQTKNSKNEQKPAKTKNSDLNAFLDSVQ